MEQQQLQHFIHPEHPLLFNPDDRRGYTCVGCRESVHGPSYSCKECSYVRCHHKSCAEPKTKKMYLTKSKKSMWTDEIEIATEITHFSHEHDLKLTDEILYNQKCSGCERDILPPFYSCAKCSFLLHKSCANLPRKKRHLLHKHPLTLLLKTSDTEMCYACEQQCNGFMYCCESETCNFKLDIQCSLIPDIFTHKGHEHQLILSSIVSRQNCSCCDSEIYPIFRCTTCKFALDFKCATLPHSTRYGKHEHPFTLYYSAENDFGEYYCNICEEERDSKYWFYYCADCNYPAHCKCILGENPNVK